MIGAQLQRFVLFLELPCRGLCGALSPEQLDPCRARQVVMNHSLPSTDEAAACSQQVKAQFDMQYDILGLNKLKALLTYQHVCETSLFV